MKFYCADVIYMDGVTPDEWMMSFRITANDAPAGSSPGDMHRFLMNRAEARRRPGETMVFPASIYTDFDGDINGSMCLRRKEPRQRDTRIQMAELPTRDFHWAPTAYTITNTTWFGFATGTD